MAGPRADAAAGRVAIESFGGVGDGSTDNTQPVAKAIKALRGSRADNQPKGGIIGFSKGVYRFSSAIPADQTDGIALEGVGGVTAGDASVPATVLLYSGDGPRFIDARGSYGFNLRRLAVRYDNPAFKGKLVDFSCYQQEAGNYLGTALGLVDDCLVGGIGITGASVLVSFHNAYKCTIRHSHLQLAQIGVRGQDAPGQLSNNIIIDDVTFDNLLIAIADARQNWKIDACLFEGTAANGVAKNALRYAYKAIHTGDGATATCFVFTNNWLGDLTYAEDCWIYLRGGSGITIRGNQFNGHQYKKGFTAIRIHPAQGDSFPAADGVEISGNYFQKGTALDLGDSQIARHTNVVWAANSIRDLTEGLAILNSEGHDVNGLSVLHTSIKKKPARREPKKRSK